MKDYKFLLKPLFYIFNILLASWLVIKIEKLHPSDFGEYETFFEPAKTPHVEKKKDISLSDKQYLKNLYSDFIKGKIDSLMIDRQLEQFLEAYKKRNGR